MRHHRTVAAHSYIEIGERLAVLVAWVRMRPGPFQLQQHETRIWAILKSIWAILKTGLDDGDPAAAETAMTVIGLCIAEGPDLRGILHSS